MDKPELLGCMHEALAALEALGDVLPEHSRSANAQVTKAREHFARAIALLQLEAAHRPAPMRLAE